MAEKKKGKKKGAAAAASPVVGAEDTYYWDSYAHLQIHREMLQDKTRTGTYKQAIMAHADECFKDKVVLDVGCGTGILSFFAAQAGAKRVYAVDASDIVSTAASVVESNGMADVIKVVKGTVEDVELPGLEEVGGGVDVIVSEWMGYLLIYESMLRSVIVARDRFLKPDGHMFPSHAKLYLAPYSDKDYFDSYVNYWDDVYGVNMSVIRPKAVDWMVAEPYVENCEPKAVCGAKPVVILDIDCKTATADMVEHVDTDFAMTMESCAQQSAAGAVPVYGFCAWFDVMFTGPAGLAGKTVTLSTAPAVDKEVPGVDAATGLRDVNPVTHWKQTIWFNSQELAPAVGDSVVGHVSMYPNAQAHRSYDIDMSYGVRPSGRPDAPMKAQQSWAFNGA